MGGRKDIENQIVGDGEHSEMIKEDREILCRMQDEISKEIYRYRIAFSNGDQEAIEKIIGTVQPGGGQLIEFMESHCSNLYIFGAGILGKEFLNTWKWKYSFRGLIDNDESKQGEEIEDVPVIGLKDIAETDKKETAIIIVNKFFHTEIEQQLKQAGFSDKNIFNFGKFYIQLNRAQYFDLEELDKNDRERFVDCGALDGNTSKYMYEWYKGNVDKIWLFEPDKISVEKCRRNMEKIGFIDYEIIEKAVYSYETKLLFNSTGNGTASLNSNGDVTVDTISLDDALGKEEPSFIKMDIEGAEVEAIKGAGEIIGKFAPKLAICVYHKIEDIEVIPRLLLKYNPDYKFYLRHYSLTMNETVLYAI